MLRAHGIRRSEEMKRTRRRAGGGRGRGRGSGRGSGNGSSRARARARTEEEEEEKEEEEVAAVVVAAAAVAAEDAAKFADATNKDGFRPRSSAYNEEQTCGGCVLGSGQRAIEHTRGASERASAPDQSPRERGKGLKTGGWQARWRKAAHGEGSGPTQVRSVEG